MKAEELAKAALANIRRLMAQSSESEAVTLDVFIDFVGSEVDGWEDRKRELQEDEEDE